MFLIIYEDHHLWEAWSGLMVSALDSGVNGPGLSAGQGHYVLFLGKTLDSYGASPHRCIDRYW